MLTPLLAGLDGAALAYFLDPDQGRRRRNITRDRVASTLRRGSRNLARTGRQAAAEAYGLSRKATYLTPRDEPPPNDATLSQRVESEVFRDPDIPKGRINVNAEQGVVVLRGEVDRPEQIRSVETAVRRVSGVVDVENLLHLPDTPAPMR